MNTPNVHPNHDETRDLAGNRDQGVHPVAPNFVRGEQPGPSSSSAEAAAAAAIASQRPTAPCCLGLVLGTREVGFALTSGTGLHAFGVLNIGKCASQEAKESRFRALVLNYLDLPVVTRVALVEAYPGIVNEPVVTSFLTWLSQVCVEKNRAIEVAPYLSVMRHFGTETEAATHRTLCRTLAKRWSVLSRFTPDAELPARGHLVPDVFSAKLPRFASPRERYWQRAFLALGTSLYAVTKAEERSQLNDSMK